LTPQVQQMTRPCRASRGIGASRGQEMLPEAVYALTDGPY